MDSFISVNRNKQNLIGLERGTTDFLKFASAVLVAVGHYAAHVHAITGNSFCLLITQFAGYIGVAVFFFLSGYGLMMSEMKKHLELWPFVKKRLSKVYLPVVFVTFVWQLVIWPKDGGLEHLPHFVYSVFWGFSDGVLWFVKVILACYMMFRIYLFVDRKVFVRSGGGKFLSLILITSLLYYGVFVLFCDWMAISIPLFTLGIIVVKYNESVYKILQGGYVILVCIIVLAILVPLYYFCGNLYAHCLLNWLFIIALLYACAKFTIIIKAPDWLSSVSYDVYLTHNKVLMYLQSIYGCIGLHHFLIGVIMVSTASYTLRKLIKI